MASIAEALRVATVTAREELTARFRKVEATVAQTRTIMDILIADKSALVMQLEEEKASRARLETQLVSALESVDKKDKEVLEAAYMVKTAMERQMVAERDLKRRTEQVYELRGRLASTTSPPPAPSLLGVP